MVFVGIYVYFQAFWMVHAFDDIIKRQIIFAVVRKIGLKTISSDRIENSLMIYHCLLWNFTLSLLSIAQSTCVYKKGIFISMNFYKRYRPLERKFIEYEHRFIYIKIVLRCNETQFNDVVFEFSFGYRWMLITVSLHCLWKNIPIQLVF